MLSAFSFAQCTSSNPGTTCNGPVTVQPQQGNTSQSAITLIDLGLAAPQPAAGQYTLSIVSGVIQESDNGNGYHTLIGPPGPQGPPQGATGAAGPAGLSGSNQTVGTCRAARYLLDPPGPDWLNGASRALPAARAFRDRLGLRAPEWDFPFPWITASAPPTISRGRSASARSATTPIDSRSI